MIDFYFQIKGKDNPELSCGFGKWSWPPIVAGMITAESKKEAHALINDQYDRKFPLRVLAEDLDSNEFLLSIREIKEDDYHTKRLFEVNICKECGNKFKVIEKYERNEGGSFEFCSKECSNKHYQIEKFNSADLFGCVPVIYRITNKINGMIYIGKTRQAFTLRWWQHINYPGETKFHNAIKQSQITDWTFEVIETIILPEDIKDVLEIDKIICDRESHYIRLFDSIENGYNTKS